MLAEPPKPKGAFVVVRGSGGLARLLSTVMEVVVLELVLAKHGMSLVLSIVETTLTHTPFSLLVKSTWP